MKIMNELKSKILLNYDDYSSRISRVIREKAIKAVKVRIAFANKSVKEFEPDDLEVMIKAEEEKLKARYKENLGIALLAYLGLG